MGFEQIYNPFVDSLNELLSKQLCGWSHVIRFMQCQSNNITTTTEVIEVKDFDLMEIYDVHMTCWIQFEYQDVIY